MSHLKNKLSTIVLLTMGLSIPLFVYAEVEKPMEAEAAAIEDCILPAEVEAMTAEQRAELTLPVCIDDADVQKEKDVQNPVIVK